MTISAINQCVAVSKIYNDQANKLFAIYNQQIRGEASSNDGDQKKCAELKSSSWDATGGERSSSPKGATVIPPNEFVLITGPSGVGKTCLALTLEEETRRDGGFFCRAKFDYQATVPTWVVDDQDDAVVAMRGNSSFRCSHNNNNGANPIGTTPESPFVTAITDLIRKIIKRNDDIYLASLQASLHEALDASELQALDASIPGLINILRFNHNNTNKDAGAVVDDKSSPDFCGLPNNAQSGSNNNNDERWLSLKGPDANDRFVELYAKLFQAIRNCTSSSSTGNQRGNFLPIVMLIDDLHWADHHSLQILKKMVTTITTKAKTDPVHPTETHDADDRRIFETRPTSHAFMLICTARLDEVPSADPLALVLTSSNAQTPLSELLSELMTNECNSINSSSRANPNVTTLSLGNLARTCVHELVTHVFGLSLDETQVLANIVFHHTGGNLFFIMQLLSVFHGDGYFQLSTSSGLWTWNKDEILSAYPIAANPPISIRSLLKKRIFQSQHSEQQLLRVASCLGATIHECLLQERFTFTPQAVHVSLEILQQWGLITFDFDAKMGCFVHDRIQEAAYCFLVPNTDKAHRAAVHLDLGRRLWKQLSPIDLETHLFAVVSQIQRGLHLLDDFVEKEDLAGLMLRAGKKATNMSSFTTAATYFGIGIALLGGRRGWKNQYKLSLALHNAAAEVEYYNGNLVRMDSLLAAILDRATTLDDKLRAYFTQMYSHGSRNDMNLALSKGLEVLAALGVTFPCKPGKIHATKALGRCCRLLRRMGDDDIMNLPLMKDNRTLVVMRFLNTIYGYSFSKNEALVCLIATRLVGTTIRHGMGAASCVGFALLGYFVVVCLA